MIESYLKKIDNQTVKYILFEGEIIKRDFNINMGYTYIIDSPKEPSKCNGRKCIILEFIDDENGNPFKAKVLFPDTKRNGKVSLEDLNQGFDLSKQDKIRDRIQELENTIGMSEDQIKTLNKKIEDSKIEIIKLRGELEKRP